MKYIDAHMKYMMHMCMFGQTILIAILSAHRFRKAI